MTTVLRDVQELYVVLINYKLYKRRGKCGIVYLNCIECNRVSSFHVFGSVSNVDKTLIYPSVTYRFYKTQLLKNVHTAKSEMPEELLQHQRQVFQWRPYTDTV